jgi:hypothetical protein
MSSDNSDNWHSKAAQFTVQIISKKKTLSELLQDLFQFRPNDFFPSQKKEKGKILLYYYFA